MNAQMFLDNFGHIASAPDGVKRLREIILHYAVSGSLVIQIDSDGEAEHDVDKAETLRDEYQRRFKIRKRKPVRRPRDEEIPFPVPANWTWARMESIACYIQRGKGPKYATSGSTRVVSQKCIQWAGFDLTLARRISDESLSKYSEERFLLEGDVLWNSTGTGTAGRVALFSGGKEPVVADSHVTVIRLTNFNPQYIWCYLASPIIQARMAPNQEASMVSGTTNQVELSTSKVSELPVPCPPVEEQKRIVAKVDELMALCDKLETQQQERDRRFPLLSRACHARFVESPTPVSLTAIFDGTENVSPADLRESILSLAVSGKLTEQRSSVTENVLIQLKNDKAALAARKLIKRDKPVTDFVGLNEIKTTIPNEWKWCRLNDIASVVRGGSPRPAGDPRFYGGEIPFLKVADVTRSKGMLVEGYTSTITKAGLRKTRLISGRTVLLTNSGATLGVPAICDFETTFNDGIAAFIFLNAAVLDEFLYLYLKSKSRWFIDIASRGQGQPNLNTDIIRATWFPLPPIDEQRQIIAKVDQQMSLIAQLEELQNKKTRVADAFAQAAISAITGTEIEEPERMKAPKTELVSRLQASSKPKAADQAPLAGLLAKHKGELAAKTLWQQSGLDIDAFYQQLRTEMANGWIVEPEKAVMKEIEAN